MYKYFMYLQLFICHFLQSLIPGPPFAFGTVLVIIAMLVAINIPETPHPKKSSTKITLQSQSSVEKGMLTHLH